MKKLIILGIFLISMSPYIYAQQQEKPNVIFILADDLGWGDLKSYGNEHIRTPNLDKLAENGLILTNFYVNSSVCSPSRASFMTGIYPARLGIHGHFVASAANNKRRGMPNYLDPEIPTITREFQEKGYTTAHFGKWHLGDVKDAPLPNAYGIDVSKTVSSTDTTAGFDLWLPSNRPVASKMVIDETIAFIKDQKDKPFFINTWLVDPHAVLAPSEEQMQPYSKYSPSSYTKEAYGVSIKHHGAPQIYYATVTEMDRQIGRLIDFLESKSLLENTIILFSSDNGPEVMEIANSSHSAAGSAGPFRGCKRSIYEGGIRVPFIISWPSSIPKGKIDTQSVVSGTDILPSLISLAGIGNYSPSNIDGEDRSEVLLGSPAPRQKPLFWEWRFKVFGRYMDQSPRLAMRQGDWKLLMNPDESRVELYNLDQDPTELHNKAHDKPELVSTMGKELKQWYDSLPKGYSSEDAGVLHYNWPR